MVQKGCTTTTGQGEGVQGSGVAVSVVAVAVVPFVMTLKTQKLGVFESQKVWISIEKEA